ncbi:MAG: hypothetical protein AB1540_10155 [Bdellovibrionota bacterium]
MKPINQLTAALAMGALVLSFGACSKKDPSKTKGSEKEAQQQTEEQASGASAAGQVAQYPKRIVELAVELERQNSVVVDNADWEAEIAALKSRGVYNFWQDGGCPLVKGVSDISVEGLKSSTGDECKRQGRSQDDCDEAVKQAEEIALKIAEIRQDCASEVEGQTAEEKAKNLYYLVVLKVQDLGELARDYGDYLEPGAEPVAEVTEDDVIVEVFGPASVETATKAPTATGTSTNTQK